MRQQPRRRLAYLSHWWDSEHYCRVYQCGGQKSGSKLDRNGYEWNALFLWAPVTNWRVQRQKFQYRWTLEQAWRATYIQFRYAPWSILSPPTMHPLRCKRKSKSQRQICSDEAYLRTCSDKISRILSSWCKCHCRRAAGDFSRKMRLQNLYAQ